NREWPLDPRKILNDAGDIGILTPCSVGCVQDPYTRSVITRAGIRVPAAAEIEDISFPDPFSDSTSFDIVNDYQPLHLAGGRIHPESVVANSERFPVVRKTLYVCRDVSAALWRSIIG